MVVQVHSDSAESKGDRIRWTSRTQDVSTPLGALCEFGGRALSRVQHAKNMGEPVKWQADVFLGVNGDNRDVL